MTAQGILVQDSRFGRNPVKWGRRQGFTTLAASLFQALTRVWRYTKSASPGCRAAAFGRRRRRKRKWACPGMDEGKMRR